MGLSELQEQARALDTQRRRLEEQITEAKRKVEEESRRVFKETGFLPDIPTTARDWQLYSTMKGIGTVARTLSAKLRKGLRRLKRRAAEVGPDAAAEECRAFVDAALDKYACFGASDTEGRSVLASAIEKHMEMLGYDVNFW
jgi:hypothetical protein